MKLKVEKNNCINKINQCCRANIGNTGFFINNLLYSCTTFKEHETKRQYNRDQKPRNQKWIVDEVKHATFAVLHEQTDHKVPVVIHWKKRHIARCICKVFINQLLTNNQTAVAIPNAKRYPVKLS